MCSVREGLKCDDGCLCLYQNLIKNKTYIPDKADSFLTFTTQGAISVDVKFAIFEKFLIFSQKTGFDISYKLSSLETIYMECQNCFLGGNKKADLDKFMKNFGTG